MVYGVRFLSVTWLWGYRIVFLVYYAVACKILDVASIHTGKRLLFCVYLTRELYEHFCYGLRRSSLCRGGLSFPVFGLFSLCPRRTFAGGVSLLLGFPFGAVSAFPRLSWLLNRWPGVCPSLGCARWAFLYGRFAAHPLLFWLAAGPCCFARCTLATRSIRGSALVLTVFLPPRLWLSGSWWRITRHDGGNNVSVVLCDPRANVARFGVPKDSLACSSPATFAGGRSHAGIRSYVWLGPSISIGSGLSVNEPHSQSCNVFSWT